MRQSRLFYGLSAPIREVCESNVETLYRRAGAAVSEVWRPSKMALQLFGWPGVVFRVGIPELGWLARRGRGFVVVVQAGLSRPILEWVVGHELAHWVRGSVHGDPAEELACDYVGAAIQMRRAVFLERARALRNNLPALAHEFGTTQTSVALRLGEIGGWSVAVVLEDRVYARGEFAGMTPAELRKLSRTGKHPGLHRAVLDDAGDQRVVLSMR